MGVDKEIQTLYQIRNLTTAGIVDICQGLSTDCNMTCPTIDVECNNVAFVVGRKGKDARTKTGAVQIIW